MSDDVLIETALIRITPASRWIGVHCIVCEATFSAGLIVITRGAADAGKTNDHGLLSEERDWIAIGAHQDCAPADWLEELNENETKTHDSR